MDNIRFVNQAVVLYTTSSLTTAFSFLLAIEHSLNRHLQDTTAGILLKAPQRLICRASTFWEDRNGRQQGESNDPTLLLARMVSKVPAHRTQTASSARADKVQSGRPCAGSQHPTSSTWHGDCRCCLRNGRLASRRCRFMSRHRCGRSRHQHRKRTATALATTGSVIPSFQSPGTIVGCVPSQVRCHQCAVLDQFCEG